MLPTWLRVLETLSSSHAPQLVVGLVSCGVILLTASDHRLAVLAFLVQRSIVVVLLWPTLGTSLGITNLIALIAVAMVSGGTECCYLRWARTNGTRNANPPFGVSIPFRALAASLGVLVAYGFAQAYAFNRLPPLVAFASIWLMTMSLLAFLLSSSALGMGLGTLTFADGCRILYALGQPNLLVWGLWSVCDVLVALGAAYLRSAEAAAQGQAAGG